MSDRYPLHRGGGEEEDEDDLNRPAKVVSVVENVIEDDLTVNPRRVLKCLTGKAYVFSQRLVDTLYGSVAVYSSGARLEGNKSCTFRRTQHRFCIKESCRNWSSVRSDTHENPEREINILREIASWSDVADRHLCRLRDCFYCEDSIYLVLDVFPIDMRKHVQIRGKCMGGLDEIDVKRYFCQLVDAVSFLHSQGIVHLDISPSNIMFESDAMMRIVLIDFGHAMRFREGLTLVGQYGKPHCYLPEMLLSNKCFDPRHADIWAIGVTLFVMLTGARPWRAPYMWEETFKIIVCGYRGGLCNLLEAWQRSVSESAISLLNTFFAFDADGEQTSSVPSFAQIQSHEWINCVGTSDATDDSISSPSTKESMCTMPTSDGHHG